MSLRPSDESHRTLDHCRSQIEAEIADDSDPNTGGVQCGEHPARLGIRGTCSRVGAHRVERRRQFGIEAGHIESEQAGGPEMVGRLILDPNGILHFGLVAGIAQG